MAGMTTAHETDCLNHMVAGSEFLYSTNLFLCLFTADPTEAGTLTNEVNYSAREAITYKAAANGLSLNNAIASIDTTGWNGTDMTHFGLSKTSVQGAGVLNWFGTLTGGPINYTPGDILTIAADAMPVTFYDAPQPGSSAGTKVSVVGSNKWLDHSLGVAQWTTLAATQVSLHTAAPATSGNEFAGGGYSRNAFTAGAPGAGTGDFQQITHTNPLSFTNIQSTPFQSWALWQGADLIFLRDQGSGLPVTPGSSIDANASTLIISVD